MIHKVDALAEKVEELIQSGWRPVVGKDVLLRRLAEALVQQTELEVVDQDVLVVGGDERRGSRPRDGHKLFRAQFLAQQLFEKKNKEQKFSLSN